VEKLEEKETQKQLFRPVGKGPEIAQRQRGLGTATNANRESPLLYQRYELTLKRKNKKTWEQEERSKKEYDGLAFSAVQNRLLFQFNGPKDRQEKSHQEEVLKGKKSLGDGGEIKYVNTIIQIFRGFGDCPIVREEGMETALG